MGLDNHLEPTATQKSARAVAAMPAKVGDSVKAGTTKLVGWTSPEPTPATTAEAKPVTMSWFGKKREPTPELYVATARMYERNGNFDGAVEQYQKALKKAPNDVQALLGYAHLLDHQNKLVEATTQYQKAIKANPKESAAYNDLGLCLARRGMIGDATKNVTKAVELQPDRVLYRNNLAKLLVEQNRSEEALANSEPCTPNRLPITTLRCCSTSTSKSRWPNTHLRQALELDPSFTQARDWTFRLAARTGNPAPAQAYSRPATRRPRAALRDELAAGNIPATGRLWRRPGTGGIAILAAGDDRCRGNECHAACVWCPRWPGRCSQYAVQSPKRFGESAHSR